MILTIGDSFTYGSELQDPKLAWSYLLGKEVINLVDLVLVTITYLEIR